MRLLRLPVSGLTAAARLAGLLRLTVATLLRLLRLTVATLLRGLLARITRGIAGGVIATRGLVHGAYPIRTM